MKRLISSTFIVVCICTIASSASQQSEEYWDKYFRTFEMHHPLLAEVFPGVAFEEKFGLRDFPGSPPYLVARYNDQVYIIPRQFNVLYAQIADRTSATIVERMEAFIRLRYWNDDPDLEIFSHEKVSIVEGHIGYRFNHRFAIGFHTEDGIDSTEVLIRFEKDQIIYDYIKHKDGGRLNIRPRLLNGMDQIQLEILGVQPQTFVGDDHEHYYIPVNENGTTTGNSITFRITGLTPNVQYVVKVEPVYWTDSNPFFQSQPFYSDEGGLAEVPWTPPDDEHTGHAEFKLYESGNPDPWVDEDKWIIPEKIKTGVLAQQTPPYRYTVYYTNQSFIYRPDYQPPYDIVEIFAEQVEVALINSWNEQVIEWELCQGVGSYSQPVDDDSNYEVAVNNSPRPNLGPDWVSLNYHGLENTAARMYPETERCIGIGAHIWESTPLNWNLSVYDPEADLINSSICHEFYHGIQWSLNGIWVGRPMGWMDEGQARFLQTVFMEEYSLPAGSGNEELDPDPPGRMYPTDANDFLKYCLNQGLIHDEVIPEHGPRPIYMDYHYCLFWRFLFENYMPSGSTTQKLIIIRETCRGNTMATMPQIESEMDGALEGYLGEYDTMDEAIRVFAKHAYFNDPEYNLWQPLPEPDLYADPPDLHLSDIFTYGIVDPEEGYILQEHDYEGEIPYVWGIDYLLYDFEQFLELPAATLTFNRDPDNNGMMGEFGVDVYTENPLTHQITTYPLIITGLESQVTFNLDPDIQDHAVVAISRQDAYELDEEYYVNITSGITVDIEPLYPPVIISNDCGGTIYYNLTVTNNSDQSVSADIWCSITYPDGAHIEDIYTTSQNLYAGQVWPAQLTHEIPIGYTPDLYHLRGYVGQIHPGSRDSKWDRDYFEFRVVDEELTEPDIAWINHYGSEGVDCSFDAYEAPNGYFYAVGTTEDNFYRIRTSASGAIAGELIDIHGDCAYSISPLYAGGHVMAGYTTRYGSNDIYMRIEGSTNWSWHWDVGIGSEDIGYDVQQTSDGDYIIAGVSDEDVCLVKARYPEFYPLWSHTYDNNGCYDEGHAVQQTADGGYIIAGTTLSIGEDDYDVYVIKTDASGNMEWDLRYPPAPDYWDYGWDVCQTPNGDYVIAGIANEWSSTPWAGDVYVFRTDAQGNVLWEHIYGPFTLYDDYEGKGLWQCDDGGFIVVGNHSGFFTIDGQDVYVVRLDGAGNQVWEMDIDLPPDDDGSYEVGESIRQNADGGYIIAGHVKSPETELYDVLLVRLEPENFVNQIFGIPPDYEIISSKPTDYALMQNYPNPFNPTTTLNFSLPQASKVRLSVYDVSGRLVATLVDGYRDAGSHEVAFDASDLASGVYLYRLMSGDFAATGKMVLMK